MEERLREVFKNINDWLKFAEAKNGALIAFNAGLLFGTLRWFKGKEETIEIVFCLVIISIFALSLLLSLWSFFPKTKAPWHYVMSSIAEQNEKDNLIFFGDLIKYGKSDYRNYLIKLSESADENLNEFSKIEIFYADQIIVNSKIAYEKYSIFKASLIMNTIGVAILILSIFIIKIG